MGEVYLQLLREETWCFNNIKEKIRAAFKKERIWFIEDLYLTYIYSILSFNVILIKTVLNIYINKIAHLISNKTPYNLALCDIIFISIAS